MTNLAVYMNELLGEEGGSKPEEPTVPKTIEDAKKDETKFDNTTTIKDGQDNNVVIPGGFHVDKESGINVEEGIVIEDDAGNQFVWIPVGTYHTTKGDKTNNLSRRTFTESGAVEVNGDEKIDSYYYGEGDSRSVAYDTIGKFKTSAISKNGFYIGRYEQGEGNVCKAGMNIEDTGFGDEEAKTMYAGNKYITSELMSSYAWDTALNFICQNSIEGYTLAVTKDKEYGNINTNKIELTGAYVADKYCNIHDMIGNCIEWTSEYSNESDYERVGRGGMYHDSIGSAAARNYSSERVSSGYTNTFRVQLYLK